jgi:hypothetical protein
MDRVPENTMTVQEAMRSVGKWVACKPGDRPAILLNVTGASCLVRMCDRDGIYSTTGVESLVRREDWDGRAEPWWLRKARGSRRPDRELAPALHPEAQLESVVLDALTFASYKTQRDRGETPDRLRRIFEDVDDLEAHYQERVGLDRDLDERIAADASASEKCVLCDGDGFALGGGSCSRCGGSGRARYHDDRTFAEMVDSGAGFENLRLERDR